MTAPRPTHAATTPAYYLGRPAAAWQAALRPRQRPQPPMAGATTDITAVVRGW